MNASDRRGRTSGLSLGAIGLSVAALAATTAVQAADPAFPITNEQRATAAQVAQAGVALSELAPNAPESHTVQRGDTLWAISKLFLTSPWRWPQLWGMNMDQIRNPHLIYPGQVLVLDKSSGRAVLRVGQQGDTVVPPSNTVKLSPRVRSELLFNGAIASIPLHLIGPFLNEAVVFENNALDLAPRIVATQEGAVDVAAGGAGCVSLGGGPSGCFGSKSAARPSRGPGRTPSSRYRSCQSVVRNAKLGLPGVNGIAT